ncbi:MULTISPECIES: hypothetical protein [unclassified Pseudoalteromonas]|uniref:hypothetical protein n=1 Tax=unclassified Pseudoalteromonas TaxID=194690 RepID=UPI000C08AB19|nr:MULTISPECIES: hypothetical protein [unclassified Pseudoalteromonas]MDP2634210.1 hypothetical protein [Pseudoalteromonas sp. 1_MG-2023]PHN90063.1 hypothetical protein CSC79_09260 [Pseudoalteromonas sp. 3D05]
MYKVILAMSLVALSGCETVESVQQDVSEFSNNLFASSGNKEDTVSAFEKAQEAYSEASKVRKQTTSLNAQQRSVWAELESDYQKLVANPDSAADKESIFSDGTLAENIMTHSLEFIELTAKAD